LEPDNETFLKPMDLATLKISEYEEQLGPANDLKPLRSPKVSAFFYESFDVFFAEAGQFLQSGYDQTILGQGR